MSLIPAATILTLMLIVIAITNVILINSVVNSCKKIGITKEEVEALKNESMLFVLYEKNSVAPLSFGEKILAHFQNNVNARVLSLKMCPYMEKKIDKKKGFSNKLNVTAIIDAVFNQNNTAPSISGVYYKYRDNYKCSYSGFSIEIEDSKDVFKKTQVAYEHIKYNLSEKYMQDCLKEEFMKRRQTNIETELETDAISSREKNHY